MFPDILTMIYAKGKTNFDDIDFLIANFLDSTSIIIETGGLNSIRRCIVSI